VSSAIDELHRAVFGFVPAKAGIAYERLAAVTMAVLGWRDVAHDVIERPPGRVAEHQLDVVARHPSGEVDRVIVECKDWDETVGKATLDALVGVRTQIGANAAAVMTTVGYTAGARKVAVDEDVALMRLRPFDPGQDEGTYVKAVEIALDAYAPLHSDFGVELAEDHTLASGNRFRVSLTPEAHLLHTDGSQAEKLDAVLRQHAAPMRDGVYQQRAEFGGVRLIPTEEGLPVPIRAVTWTETVSHETTVIRSEMRGEPQLVVEQLDEKGAAHGGRVVVDHDLYAWQFDDDNKLEARGSLARPR
jgi:Restriction endonuclease